MARIECLFESYVFHSYALNPIFSAVSHFILFETDKQIDEYQSEKKTNE